MTDKETLAILKRAVRDYQDIKFAIGVLKELNCDFDAVKFCLKSLNCIGITNEEDEYLDFNFKDMTLTIRRDYDLYLSDSIEVWDNLPFPSVIRYYNNIEEMQKEIKELTEKIMQN